MPLVNSKFLSFAVLFAMTTLAYTQGGWSRWLPVLTLNLACADESSFESEYGLLAEYTQGTEVIRRIDPRPAFDWQTETPDVHLPVGPFTALWTGSLLVREGGSYQFHAQLNGRIKVTVDSTVLLEQAGNGAAFVSGKPAELSPGEREIVIEYSSPLDSSPASVQIFWSSDRFTLEPLPADVLFAPMGDMSQLHLQAQGASLADALRCVACHDMPSALPTLAAPDLRRLADGSSMESVISRIRNPSSVVSNSRMPHFDFSEEQATQVAAFLISRSDQPRSDKTPVFKDGDLAVGTTLLLSSGCIACHELPATVKQQADAAGSQEHLNPSVRSPYAAPSLAAVAERRSAGWLNRWLKDPASLNSSHRMPIFDLSDEERRQMVAALSVGASSVKHTASETAAEEIVAAGRKLVVEARCSSCHSISGLERVRDHQSALKMPLDGVSSAVGPTSCIRPEEASGNPKLTPMFRLSEFERQALTAWYLSILPEDNFSAGKHAIHKVSSFDRGKLLLHRNQCLSCHDRDHSRGLSAVAGVIEHSHESLRGLSQGFVPPSLTAVGDKLKDDYLKAAVAGLQKPRRLTWLTVRMPRFIHSPQDVNDLARHLTASDRIPDSADLVRPDIASASKAITPTAEELLLGNQLTGAGGFNCVACHQAGSFEPRNVALGTRGSDLLTMGSRIRPRFFQRWMKNPIRVVAGIEMPAIKRAAPGVLNESLNEQMAVIWRSISDPRFTAPTVVSRYEQFVNVEPGQAPRIIRDVFTIGEGKDREGVARSLAVGFENGHNLLIDLDTLQLRQWTVGEFARQRTEGKSWFWSTAGIEVARLNPIESAEQFLLQMLPNPVGANASGGRSVMPVEDEGRIAELLRYSTDAEGVTLWYRLHYPVNGSPAAPPINRSAAGDPHNVLTAWNDPDRPVRSVIVRERIQPIFGDNKDGKTASGWSRTFLLQDADPGSLLVLNSPEMATTGTISSAKLEFVAAGDTRPASGKALTLSMTHSITWRGTMASTIPRAVAPDLPAIVTTKQDVTTLPGFKGERLPLNASIMPTAMTWLPDGRMAFTSLKGHVWFATDSDGDGLPDRLSLFEEGLAAPFGILSEGDSIIVSHKPEILRLRDTDGDGRADHREVIAAGWGLTDDYHDWTSGLVRDQRQNLFVGIGSDYSQKNRPQNRDRWRGTVLKVDPSGVVSPMAYAFRYPMGLAFDGQGRLYATDNQGVQNTFNEINHIVQGTHYGVPSRHFVNDAVAHATPALQVPHPWTRSVNSILFFSELFESMGIAGHGLGCEYDLRYLIRFTVQQVGDVMQGASYPFSLPNQEAGGSNFIGPICSAISPDGDLYIGSIWDSGWQGGPNTGGITRLRPDVTKRPNGIQEVIATPDGFRITFFSPVDRVGAADSSGYSIQGYTRVWGGSYATPDSDQHKCNIETVTIEADSRVVDLKVNGRREGYLYDLNIVGKLADSQELWPSEAHYFLRTIPKASD